MDTKLPVKHHTPISEKEFRQRWNNLMRMNEELDRRRQGKRQVKFGINNIIVYPICNFVYWVIDKFKKK